MLAGLGLGFRIAPQEIDERVVPGESPETYARRVARQKARSALEEISKRSASSKEREPEGGHVVLGADTIVVRGDGRREGDILVKPVCRKEAHEMISSLSDRSHMVASAYWIEDETGRSEGDVIWTEVHFRALLDSEIEDYLSTGEWEDKAGAYGIQGAASFMVKELHGSYTNVVGLPLAEVSSALRRMGCVRRLFGASGRGAGRPETERLPGRRR
jgi:septum formation protein